MKDTSWDTASLTPWVASAIASLGFSAMTPVQASAIPLFMQHKDVVVEAVTGSGKTLAFLVPVLEKLLRRDEQVPPGCVGALILCPTRELAMQIYSVYNSLVDLVPQPAGSEHIQGLDTSTEILDVNKDQEEASVEAVSENEDGSEEIPVVPAAQSLGLSAQLLIGGGASVQQDINHFRRTHATVLIGTPGRVNDFFRTCTTLRMSELEMLVMDEADRLLDMGFHDALETIIQRLPKQRRTGLFSATMTDAVSQLVRTGLRNPVKIVVSVKAKAGQEKRTPMSLQIGYMVVHPAEKILQMIRLLHYSLETDKLTKSIIYFPTCAAVDYYQPLLSKLPSLTKFALIPLHGKQAPSVRHKNFERFISLGIGTPSALLTTDLAARGLDVPDVDLVVQVDPPQDPSAFSHRCGRAGRAGRAGKAIVLLNEGREEEFVPFLKVRKTPVSRVPRLDENNQVTAQQDQVQSTRKFNDDLRALVRTDRDFYERGIKAFVSYIRFYSKHQAVYIFRLQDLDLSGVAACYGLLRLPLMPELKGRDIDFESETLDMTNYAYADKIREKARQAALEKISLEGPRPQKAHKPRPVQWSNKIEAQERKEMRRTKKKRRLDAIKAKEPPAPDNAGSDEENDWKEMKLERRAKVQRTKPGGGAFDDL